MIAFSCIFVLAGCASIHAYMYVLTKSYDGKAVLKKEGDVEYILKQIIENEAQYTMKAYTRTAISYKVKKTKDTTHSFYVITCDGEKYQTLSFSATGKWAVSKGAWAMNTDTDIASYEDYFAYGAGSKWNVEEIETKNGINTQKTITNVVAKINSDNTYYYRAKVNKNDKVDNCNTALLETIAVN
jgi:hypothetical protein